MVSNLQGVLSFLFDSVIIISLAVYLYTEGYTAPQKTIIRCITFACATLGATIFYPSLSLVLSPYLPLPLLYIHCISYFVIALGIVLFPLLFFLKKKNITGTILQPITIPFNFITFFFFLLLIFQIVLSSGVKMPVKNFIASSRIASFLLVNAQRFEQLTTLLEGKGSSKTLQVITIPSRSHSTTLPFKAATAQDDREAENTILTLINNQRKKKKLSLFEKNNQLSRIARNYAHTMISQEFFSYETKSGYSLVDQIDQADIYYLGIGQSIFFATHEIFSPIAFNMLETKQILSSSDFTRIGVGVQDASSYGKVIVLIFLQ